MGPYHPLNRVRECFTRAAQIQTTPGESDYLQQNSILSLAQEQLLAGAAIQNFETALTETPGDARSLHGAFHVFEAHHGDFLLA